MQIQKEDNDAQNALKAMHALYVPNKFKLLLMQMPNTKGRE